MPDILGINLLFHEYVTAQWKLQCMYMALIDYMPTDGWRQLQFTIMFRLIEYRDFTSVALRDAQRKGHDTGL